MKHLILVSMTTLLLALTGCSTAYDPERQARYSPYDENYMRAYETAARRGGARVYWVNLPYQQSFDPGP